MKIRYVFLVYVATLFVLCGCTKENDPVASDNLGIPELFAPDANADPVVKMLYNDYGLWVKMDFKDSKEVTNAILSEDVNNRYGATMIDDTCRQEALTYTKTLMSNISKRYAKAFFPLEFFYVKTYNGSYWKADYQRIGRSRLVICWPNEMVGALPVVDEENHYYQDSVLTYAIWQEVGGMISARMEEPIKEFVLVGKAYDKGEAYDNIREQYDKDGDEEKYGAAVKELCEIGGFISPSGAGSFEADFSGWLNLIVLESYDNIKKNYLDNSRIRAAKYDIIIEYFKGYDWDIQAAGDKYRQRFDEYKASLPPVPEPEPDPEPLPEE